VQLWEEQRAGSNWDEQEAEARVLDKGRDKVTGRQGLGILCAKEQTPRSQDEW